MPHSSPGAQSHIERTAYPSALPSRPSAPPLPRSHLAARLSVCPSVSLFLWMHLPLLPQQHKHLPGPCYLSLFVPVRVSRPWLGHAFFFLSSLLCGVRCVWMSACVVSSLWSCRACCLPVCLSSLHAPEGRLGLSRDCAGQFHCDCACASIYTCTPTCVDGRSVWREEEEEEKEWRKEGRKRRKACVASMVWVHVYACCGVRTNFYSRTRQQGQERGFSSPRPISSLSETCKRWKNDCQTVPFFSNAFAAERKSEQSRS